MKIVAIDLQDGNRPVQVAVLDADTGRLEDYIIAARNALLYRQDCIDALKAASQQMTSDGHNTSEIDELLEDMGVCDG